MNIIEITHLEGIYSVEDEAVKIGGAHLRKKRGVV